MTDRESDPLIEPAPAEPAAAAEPAARGAAPGGRRGRRHSENMLPQRDRRPWPERLLVRLVATCGIVGIGVAIAAIMVSSNDQGWMVGLVVSIVSVILAAVLWSSRVL
jgi:protein-S-isoprenylcysteine O-methyltransferase Ste14